MTYFSASKWTLKCPLSEIAQRQNTTKSKSSLLAWNSNRSSIKKIKSTTGRTNFEWFEIWRQNFFYVTFTFVGFQFRFFRFFHRTGRRLRDVFRRRFRWRFLCRARWRFLRRRRRVLRHRRVLRLWRFFVLLGLLAGVDVLSLLLEPRFQLTEKTREKLFFGLIIWLSQVGASIWSEAWSSLSAFITIARWRFNVVFTLNQAVI